MTVKELPYNSKQKLDQFYTNPEIAKNLYSIIGNYIPIDEYDWFLEPSAGRGSFLNQMPGDKRIGLDLDPQHPEVIFQDFLEYEHKHEGRTLVVGNPPFGMKSKLAVEFFNRCATFADTICFIVPMTWEKYRVQKKLDLRYKLIYSEQIPEKSFIRSDKPHNVNCLFQIWTVLEFEELRLGKSVESPKVDLRQYIPPIESHPDFEIGKCGTQGGTKTTDDDFKFVWVGAGRQEHCVEYDTKLDRFTTKPISPKDGPFKILVTGERPKHIENMEIYRNTGMYEKISPKDGPFKLVYVGLRETQTADLDTNLRYSTLQDINPKPIHKTISVRDIFEAIDWKKYSKKCTGPLYIDKEMIVNEYTLKKKELLGY